MSVANLPKRRVARSGQVLLPPALEAEVRRILAAEAARLLKKINPRMEAR
jgi:hypothetical protein